MTRRFWIALGLLLWPALAQGQGLADSQGLGQGAVNGPAGQQTPFQCSRLESEGAFPLCNRLAASQVLNEMVVPVVVRLHERRGPDAVTRLVVAVGVQPLYGVAFRARPHVGAERLEAVAPSVAHRDASSAVILKRSCTRVEAARFRGAPRTILACVELSVREVAIAGRFVSQTTAALRESDAERTADHHGLSPALALAYPRGASLKASVMLCAMQNRESSEYFASKIDHAHITHYRPEHV